MRKISKAEVSCSSHRNLGCVSWGIVVLEQNTLSQFAPHLTRDFLTQMSQFFCIELSVYGTTLLNIVNHDFPLTISKIEAITFAADGTHLNVFKSGEPGCFHCMLCFLHSGPK
jgi:hypothetical protein